MRFGCKVFMPKVKHTLMATFFDNLEIGVAEDNVCNFDQDYKEFW
jgi:hypothetical protein